MYRKLHAFILAASFFATLSVASQSQPEAQTVYSALWRIDHNFQATLRMGNSSPSEPITVSPVLFMANGLEFALPPVELSPSSIKTVNINDALARAPAHLASRLSQYGSIALRFTAESAVRVAASVELLDPVSSLSFVSQCSARGSESSSTQLIEGLWWKRDERADGFVAFTNTTGKALSSSYQVVTAKGVALHAHPLSIGIHNTVMVGLHDLLAEVPASESMTGGLRIRFQGKPGDLLVFGGLENPWEGYSARMPFVSALQDGSNGKLQSRTYASVGLMAGMPMDMMGFPDGTTFRLYSTLRNTTDRPLDVRISFNYTGEKGTVTIPVSPETLPPLQSKQLNVRRMLKQAGLSDFNGMLNMLFNFEGKGGDLIVATGSIDETGNYVFEVQPQGLSKSLGKEVSYWSAANGYDTMIGLLNGSESDEDFTVTFRLSGRAGTYKLPVHIVAHGSTNIDVAELISQNQPDSDGNVFGESREGSAAFTSAKGGTIPMNLGVSVGIFNVKAATCTFYCVDCDGYRSVAISPSQFTLLLIPPGTKQLTLKGDYHDPARNLSSTDTIDSALITWSPSNPAVATVSDTGLVTAQSAGGFSALATATLTPDGGASTSCDYQCPDDRPFNGISNGVVQPPTATITLNFSGNKTPGDNISFLVSQYACSESLGLFNCPVPSSWVWNLEGTVAVNDDVSKWTISQSVTSAREKGFYRDSGGNLVAYDTGVFSVANDGPRAVFTQQPQGQVIGFWVDDPGQTYNYIGNPVDSMTEVQNFQVNVCSTQGNYCYSASWYVKIVVDSGPHLNATSSTAGTGSISASF